VRGADPHPKRLMDLSSLGQTFGAEKQLISCRFRKALDLQPDRYERKDKRAGFVDFVVFSLEIDRVRRVPERVVSSAKTGAVRHTSLLVRRFIDHAKPYRGFESSPLRQVAILSLLIIMNIFRDCGELPPPFTPPNDWDQVAHDFLLSD